MILCGVGTFVPLIFGVLQNQLVFSIYGALIGYLLALNDHLGPLKHRVWIITLTFVVMLAGIVAGYHLQPHEPIYLICIGILSYWLGVLAGEGAEIEKAVQYATLGLLVAHSATNLLPSNIPAALNYVILGYLTLMVFIPLLLIFKRRKPDPFHRIRESLKKSFTKQREKHIHAASYALITLLSIWLTERFQIERGYWVTVTVLLVMKPNRIQSFYIVLQRLIGTALAVLLVDILIQLIHGSSVLVISIVVCAFLVPWAVKRNYWIVSFFVTIMVVLLIELAATHHGDIHTAFVRLEATLLGCLLSLIGSGTSKLVDLLDSKRA
jgi:uncharacterized membrane protein YccC